MPQPQRRRIPRIKKAMRVNELLDLYAVWGGPTTRAAISLWLQNGKRFPNARKASIGENSPWIVPISDVVNDVKKQWPNGPIQDAISDLPPSLRPTLRHICIAAYNIDIDSLSPENKAMSAFLPRQLYDQ